ncbi:hypothetical protein SDC9_138459 [bioreactor metagenome]|uniref:Uncharacterized protein n=1 Tax=bioreactor metagenome TaxID=1076179 RepID=A0A645DPX2_9ZZZZ
MNENVKRIVETEIIVAKKTASKMRALSISDPIDSNSLAEAWDEYAQVLKSLLSPQNPTVSIQSLIGQLTIATTGPLPDCSEADGLQLSRCVKDALIEATVAEINTTEVLLSIVRQKKVADGVVPRPFELRIQCDTPAQVERVATLLLEAGLMDYDWKQNLQQ